MKNVASAGRFYSAGALYAQRQPSTMSTVLAAGEPVADVPVVQRLLRPCPATTAIKNGERNGFSPAR